MAMQGRQRILGESFGLSEDFSVVSDGVREGECPVPCFLPNSVSLFTVCCSQRTKPAARQPGTSLVHLKGPWGWHCWEAAAS